MIKLTRGQKAVLILTSAPMAAVGIAGGIASYFNFASILYHASMAVSVVLAGEGATLVAALVYLLLTLLGQHTPKVVRAALWLLPATGSVAGGLLADTANDRVVMTVAPLAMTVAAEGVALVARRIVAFQTGVDIEQQRRSGALLWHANRSQNGGWLGRKLSKLAVWRLTRQFAETDAQMSVQLGEVQRFRIAEGADANLTAALSGTAAKGATRPAKALSAPAAPQLSAAPAQPATEAHAGSLDGVPLKPNEFEHDGEVYEIAPAFTDDPTGNDFIKSVLAEAESHVATDPAVKLLTAAEVAALKGVSAGTVRSWAHRGKLPVFDRDESGRSLFNQVDVMALD